MFPFDAYMNIHYMFFDVWSHNFTQFAFQTLFAQIILFVGLKELIAYVLVGLKEPIAYILVGLEELVAYVPVGLEDEQVSVNQNQEESVKRENPTKPEVVEQILKL